MFKYVVYDSGIRCSEYGYDVHGSDEHYTKTAAVRYLLDWIGRYHVEASRCDRIETGTTYLFDADKECSYEMKIELELCDAGDVLKDLARYLVLLNHYNPEQRKEFTKYIPELVKHILKEEAENSEVAFYKDFIRTLSGLKSKDNANVKTYVIHNQELNLVKIGRSNRVKSRIRDIENMAGVPLPILKVFDEDIERELHQKFKHLRAKGEWFSYNDEIRNYLASH